MLEAVFYDIASGDDADKRVLVIYDGYEILAAGPMDQFTHIGVYADGNMIFAAGDLHDATGFG